MVLKRLIKEISDVLAIDPEGITEESSFVDDLGADSLDVMEIIIKLEDKFNIKIPVEQAAGIKTVGDAAREIEKAKRNSKS